MKKSLVILLSVLCLAIFFAGCGTDTVSDMGSGATSTIDSAKDKVESGLMGSDTNGNNNSNNHNSNNSNNSNNNNNNNTDNSIINNNNSVTAKISRDEAKDIAFKHANIKEADAYDIDIDLDEENGVYYYDIDFDTKSTEYDYRIHSTTGEVIKSHKEAKDSTNN